MNSIKRNKQVQSLFGGRAGGQTETEDGDVRQCEKMKGGPLWKYSTSRCFAWGKAENES